MDYAVNNLLGMCLKDTDKLKELFELDKQEISRHLDGEILEQYQLEIRSEEEYILKIEDLMKTISNIH